MRYPCRLDLVLAAVWATCSFGILGVRVDDDLAVRVDDDLALAEAGAHGSSLIGVEATVELLSWQAAFKEDPELFEGCSKIFLDVGANRGTHVRKLYEPSKYPDAPYLKVFDEAFGPATVRTKPSAESGLCAFGFEANPRWAKDLKAIETAYAKKGWRAKFFVPTAVSDKKGTLKLTMAKEGASKSDWGASVVAGEASDRTIQVEIPAADLASFVQTLGKKSKPGYRLMKMDIEGSEYVVLPSFLKQHLLCKASLDQVTIEWHYLPGNLEAAFCRVASSFSPLKSMLGALKDHHFEMGAMCDIPDIAKSALEVKRDVEDKEKCKPGEPTLISDIDDESYLSDGMPLP
eukprot:TRINITY_DN114796_c0_g1_i1.p1 TRINITY_DN114796_c0_g1~~TRINITY_DN114796_c0_g1_i1.p1  ORF type:complete len:347 (+),score=105.80 TRINITY_DN114796_c0_g1_i1:99-1139(+)